MLLSYSYSMPFVVPAITYAKVYQRTKLSAVFPACRAKAGGKQSSKDATGKYAKSAGSQIRRYNEVCCI